MDELQHLEYLAVVSKTTELLQHNLGSATNVDKSLVEYVIHLYIKSKNWSRFKERLENADISLSDKSFENIYKSIDKIYPKGYLPPDTYKDFKKTIKNTKNKRKRNNDSKENTLHEFNTDFNEWDIEIGLKNEENNYKSRKFPGLAISDDENRVKQFNTIPQSLTETSSEDIRSSNLYSEVKSSDNNRIILTKKDSTIFEKNNDKIDFDNDDKLGFLDDDASSGERSEAENVKSRYYESYGDDDNHNKRGRSQSRLEKKDAKNEWSPIRVNGNTMDLNMQQNINNNKNTAKRLTSPERWEIKQLISAGVLDSKDYPNIDADGDGPVYEDREEDVDIEINEEEPVFLKGQTRMALNLSPVRIVKNPEGSLNRAAEASSQQAKERRELKRQALEEGNANTGDVAHAWEDPMAKGKLFASDTKKVQNNDNNMPEWKRKTFDNSTTFGKITDLSIREQRESLPIFKLRDTIINAVTENQVLVVVGDTGSGKTTQMTQFLAEEGFADKGMIGCTQPRRVAAISVAKRVADEVGCTVGDEVGYTIRFEDCTSKDTKIKYMTDGMLLRECITDGFVSKYSVLILDEAHERTIHTDVLFGLLKKLVKRRPDLKLIVTSATLDAEKFSSYFYNCPILTIPGRTYPVEVLYSKEPQPDYLESSLVTVMQIHLTEPSGDILLFLTGQEEIDTAAEILYERMKTLGPSVPELIILPVYSALPSEMQTKIFEPAPPGARKVVIATNIAETSITIDGIFYVVDPGFVKQNSYDPNLGMDALKVVPISQAQARQRSGRAGRTGPGKAYRLYTEAAYKDEMLPSIVPDIQRMNLSNVVLMLKAMGINDLINFDFMDSPPIQTLVSALELLYQLGALDEEGLLTRIGRRMAEFPLEPQLAKMLILSVDLGCSEEILTIVAMLSVQNIWYRPKAKQVQADMRKSRFHQSEGDHITLLVVFNSWKNSKFSNAWCFENYVQARSLKRALDVRKQLLGIMEKYHQEVKSANGNYVIVRKAICAGFFRHASKKDPQEGFKTVVESTPVYIHPSSSLFHKQPEWVVYHELVLTSKEYMREVIAVDPRWLIEVAPAFFKNVDSNAISKIKQKEKLNPLHNPYAKNPNEWRISKKKKSIRASQGF